MTCWVDRGFYRVGDVMRARLASPKRSINKPISGRWQIELVKNHLPKDGKPIENGRSPIGLLPTDAGGPLEDADQSSRKQGQYRLSCKVTDAEKHTVEGGYLVHRHREKASMAPISNSTTLN